MVWYGPDKTTMNGVLLVVVCIMLCKLEQHAAQRKAGEWSVQTIGTNFCVEAELLLALKMLSVVVKQKTEMRKNASRITLISYGMARIKHGCVI